jgi:CO/xanthine dehydrogenase Mo-binding subunit
VIDRTLYRMGPGTERFLQPVIAADRVRYVGEPLAVVLGDSPALAEDGVGAIALDIAELPPVPDRHASGRGEILLFEGAGTNAAMVFTGVKGDATRRFATPTTSGATGSQSSAIRYCRWSRAVCLPSGMRRRAG